MPEKEDIAAFPRGGKEALPALERKRLREEGKAQAQKDFLSDRPGSKKQKTTNQVQILPFFNGYQKCRRV